MDIAYSVILNLFKCLPKAVNVCGGCYSVISSGFLQGEEVSGRTGGRLSMDSQMEVDSTLLNTFQSA